MVSGLRWHKEVRDLAARFFAELSGLEKFSVTTHAGVGGPLIHIHVKLEQVDAYGRANLQAIGRRVGKSIANHYMLTQELHINDPGVSIITTYRDHE